MNCEYNISDKELKSIIRDYNGQTVICDEEVIKFYPERVRNTNKGDYGSANLIAGSKRYPGAAALAVSSALRSGCGYVKLTCDKSVKLVLAARYPSVIFSDEIDYRSQAIAIGMGSGVSKELYEQIGNITQKFTGILIIDADGLNSIAQYGTDVLFGSKCRIILTPHPKEFSRLLNKGIDEILEKPILKSEEFAKKYKVTLLLKGAFSIVTDGYETVIITRGSTALAKGGSGDMLSGYMAGSAARGLSAFDSAVCSAYTLGVSAEISSEQKTDYCATSQDILNNLHFAVKRLTGKK